MSDCIIVVDRNNEDRNSVAEIASAVGEVGSVMNVNEDQYLIEASVPAHEVPTVKGMTGVSYIRCVFSYFCGNPPFRAA